VIHCIKINIAAQRIGGSKLKINAVYKPPPLRF
jgi:hypothetical protein